MTKQKPEERAIMYQLMNFERNRKILEHIPHIRYLDMAIVFYYWKDPEEPMDGACLISKRDMAEWGYSLQQLEELATYNTPRKMPVSFHSMEDILMELLGDEAQEEVRKDPVIPMHILTNQEKLFGAAAILYPQVLWAVSHTLQSDLYILPSSIHECIIVPTSVVCTRTELEEIVRDINDSQVPDQEILSNRVFLYSREEDSIKL